MSNYYGSRATFRSPRAREDVDPMASLGNIGDIMLVFACGLMTALVIAWNVDLGQFAQVEVGEEEAIEAPADTHVVEGGGSIYIERGVVYQDTETGKYYLVQEDEPASAAESR